LPPVLLALGVYAGEAVEHSLDWTDNRMQRCALAAVDSSEVATKWPGQETDGSYENGYLKPAIEGHDAPAKIGIANATANEDAPGLREGGQTLILLVHATRFRSPRAA
jgi:hypothetical protein